MIVLSVVEMIVVLSVVEMIVLSVVDDRESE